MRRSLGLVDAPGPAARLGTLGCVATLAVLLTACPWYKHAGESDAGHGGNPPAACGADVLGGCPCSGADACTLPGGASGACETGFCTPTGCARGAANCGCFSDGTCDAVGGVPLTCLGNICVAQAAPAQGSVGASCTADVTTPSGVLECRDGETEQPGCPSGDLGCPCGDFGRCGAFGSQAVRCFQNTCTLGGCTAGSLGCACSSGSCDSGLNCQNGLCRGNRRVQMGVTGADLRACDLLLREPSLLISDVTFGAAVLGEHVHRSPDLAVSVIARDDAALADGVLTLEMHDETNPAAANIQVTRVRCYDRLGRPVPGATATLHP